MMRMKSNKVKFAVAATALPLVVAGCVSVYPDASSLHTDAPSSLPSGASASPSIPGVVSPSSTPSGSTGDSYDISYPGPGGADITYRVTLVAVSAIPVSEEAVKPSAGDIFEGAEFTITGITGTATDDADDDAGMLANGNALYSPVASDVFSGPSFNHGTFTVSPGESETGWVVFSVPSAAVIKLIQWTPGNGLSQGNMVTWNTESA